MFTGLGAFLFIISTEAMEQVLGQGLLGGVMIGVLFLGLRSPVLRIIDGVSGRLIPANYTPEETAYLEAYKTAMEDLIITVEERRLLETLAKTYSIEPDRVRKLNRIRRHARRRMRLCFSSQRNAVIFEKGLTGVAGDRFGLQGEVVHEFNVGHHGVVHRHARNRSP